MAVVYIIATLLSLIAIIYFGQKWAMAPSKSAKSPEKTKPISKQESILQMFKNHGWNERKCIELSIKHCETMFLNEKEDYWAYSTIETDWLRLKYYFEAKLKQFDEERNIKIIHYPLSHDVIEIDSLISGDNKLRDEISKKSKELALKDIEIFNTVSNIIVTEEGYYAAIYILKTNVINS